MRERDEERKTQHIDWMEGVDVLFLCSGLKRSLKGGYHFHRCCPLCHSLLTFEGSFMAYEMKQVQFWRTKSRYPRCALSISSGALS